MKDNNRAVNDIFQNDNSKNKTKTILLLTIVAIILISVFLIIAWVMTRDNPIQNMQNQNETQNEPRNQTLPYAHNISNEQNPLGLNTEKGNNDILGLKPDSKEQNGTLSSIPPMGVPTTDSNPAQSPSKPQETQKDDFEKDDRFQAAMKQLETQHQDKKAEPKDTKKETPKQEIAQNTTKVVNPLPPKETTIVKAPDPTKTTQKPKTLEQNVADKKETPKQTATTKPKEPEKVATATAQKPQEKTPNDNIIQKPQNNVDKTMQGKAPEQGYYLQVGVFSRTPERSFINKIAKYNYRILKVEDGTSKYLIGPFISQNKAKEQEQKVKSEVESNATVIFYKKQKPQEEK